MRKVSIGLGTLAAMCVLALPASALAAQQFTLTPKITGKLGGAGALTFAFGIGNDAGGLPSPLTGQLTALFPAGVSYSALAANAKHFPTCSAAVITADAGATPPTACPKGSLIGTGQATFAANIGGSPLSETTQYLNIYLSSASPVSLTFWSYGATPIQETKVFTGTLGAASGQYGIKLVNNIPTITTTPGGPDASVTAFTSTISASVKVKKGKKTTVYPFIPLPKKLKSPLNWSATATYEDGTSTTVTATTPAP